MYVVRYSRELTIGYQTNHEYNLAERMRLVVVERYPGISDEDLEREFISALTDANVNFQMVTVNEIPLRSSGNGISERRVFADHSTDGKNARTNGLD